MVTMKYFTISDCTSSCFEADVARFEPVSRPGACRKCAALPRGSGPPDTVRVKSPNPGDAVGSFESWVLGVTPQIPSSVAAVSCTSWGFGVIHVEVIATLGDAARQCLRLGSMVDKKGRPINEYRTFVATECIIRRGNKESQHWICPSCGALVYNYWPASAAPYTTVAALHEQLPIYEFGTMELLLREDILEQIPSSWQQLLSIKEIKVRTKSIDGLPADIKLWPTKEQLHDYKPNLPPWMKPN